MRRQGLNGRRATAACLGAAVLALTAPIGADAAGPSPLHATRGGAAPSVYDAGGRQVLLRGVNVNQLGDYFRAAPDLDPTVPLTEQDFADIARVGFDSVRLIVTWSALEPQRGAFDAAYLARIRQAVAWARRHQLYVVLDMHQDAWGKYIATPPGEPCLPGFQRAIGWDGAPQWATIADGLPTCHERLREVAPAVAQAFTNFYADRDGVQGELVRTWARLAREFAADPTVAGYDLLNEPHPGYAPGPVAATLLGAYYARAIDAIRAAERGVRGGFAHVAFFEPNVTWSATAVDAVPAPTFTSDRNIVFAPHIYAGSLSADRALGVSVLSPSSGFQLARAVAATYGTTIWSGEWGWFGDPATAAPSVEEYARQEDGNLAGGAWWDWKQACGDPHQIGVPGGRPGSVSPSLNRFACPGNVPLGIPAAFGRVLSRPYPRAAPGRLTALSSDPATGTFSLRGSDEDPHGSCRLDVWVPGGAGRPRVTGTNVRRIRIARNAGGWRVAACASGAYELHRA
jgi:endoglycosylceramidase